MKIEIVKAEAYIVSIDRKITVYRLEACEITFFGENAYRAVHSTYDAVEASYTVTHWSDVLKNDLYRKKSL